MALRPYEDVLDFWFVQHTAEDRFGGKKAFDDLLRAEFEDTHRHVGLGEGFSWRAVPEGRLAEIIVLDQFSRQLYRGKGTAFAWDMMALALAQELVAGGHDKTLGDVQRKAAYMPYMHSESLVIQKISLELFGRFDDEKTMEFARAHHEVIERFGRFPKRNAALGRESTKAEIDYIEGIGDRVF